MKKLKIHTFLLLLFCFYGKISAQKKLDSILDAITIQIYETPDGVIEKAKSVFKESYDPKTKVNSLMLISNAYLSKRENEKSLEYALKARDYLPEIESVKTKINVLNTIGMQHQQLRIYDKAIEYLDEALALVENFKQQDSIITLLGYNYAARGFIYREQMSCDIALNYFDKSIVQYKKGGNEKTRSGNLSTLYYNKGNCMLRLSKIDSARANFEKSIHYAQTVDAKSLYAFAKKGLSEVYTAEGNYTEAINILKEAEKASENVGDLILNQGIYKNLSDNYLAVNNSELYTLYFEKSNEVQNQINEKEQKTINNSISNLVAENKAQTENELSRLQNYRWILIALILILLFIWGNFILKNFKKYKKSKEKLETLKR